MERVENEKSYQVENKKYDIVFVGGGPSTLSFFSYLTKRNLLENMINSLNILIIEKSDYFGSGCLGKYGINSNTSAEGFVRLVCYSEEGKNNEGKYTLSPSKKKVSNDNQAKNTKLNNNKLNKDNMIVENKQSYKYRTIPMFLDVFQSLPAQTLISIGSKPAPLPLIGHFMDCIGNTIAEHISKNYNKNIITLNSEVISIKNNKEALKSDNYVYDITYRKSKPNKSSTNIFTVSSKIVVLASGARQNIDQNARKEILNLINQNDFYHSDYILQENGYSTIVTNLKQKKTKNVVIIGGSHSGFSCAWMLLNQPVDYSYHCSNINALPYKVKLNSECEKCKLDYCCFGSVKNKNWKFNSKNFNSAEIEITILYRDHIKVYYHSEKEALNDGYNAYDPKRSVNKNGNVYPFIGIRGDAKELYRKIVKGNEKRVKLVKAKLLSDHKNLLENAAAVIWACGYTTEKIPIFDKISNKTIYLIEDHNNQYEVDRALHLMLKDKSPLNSLLGIGQGYSTNSIEILSNGKPARADSVNLYNTYISKKLFRTLEDIFPNKINNETLVPVQKENNQNSNQFTNINLKSKEATFSSIKMENTLGSSIKNFHNNTKEYLKVTKEYEKAHSVKRLSNINMNQSTNNNQKNIQMINANKSTSNINNMLFSHESFQRNKSLDHKIVEKESKPNQFKLGDHINAVVAQEYGTSNMSYNINQINMSILSSSMGISKKKNSSVYHIEDYNPNNSDYKFKRNYEHTPNMQFQYKKNVEQQVNKSINDIKTNDRYNILSNGIHNDFINPLVRSTEFIIKKQATNKTKTSLKNENFPVKLNQFPNNNENLGNPKFLNQFKKKEDFDISIPHPSNLQNNQNKFPPNYKTIQLNKEKGNLNVDHMNNSNKKQNLIEPNRFQNANRHLIYDSSYKQTKNTENLKSLSKLSPRQQFIKK